MSIGKYLKQIRINKKITLQAVSKELRISYFFLEAIENDDFQNILYAGMDIMLIDVDSFNKEIQAHL